jgi:ubiquinone/menaquinone biosynthesis C-methylase UbiE
MRATVKILVFCVFAFLFEESFFSWLDIKNIRAGNQNFLLFLWTLFGVLLISIGLVTHIKRKKELREASQVLQEKRLGELERKIQYFDLISKFYDKWKKRNFYYHDELQKILQFLIPEHASVIEVGCGTGDVLGGLSRDKMAGVDISHGMVKTAARKYPQIHFEVMSADNLDPGRLNAPYDYLFMSDLIGHLDDVQKVFEESKKLMHDGSRLIITYYSYLWEPALRLLEKLYLKMPQFRQNWLSMTDIKNLIELAGMRVFKKGTAFMFPLKIPIISWIMNKFIVRLPLLRHLGLIQYIVAEQQDLEPQDYSLSVIIPARNESGNIEKAVRLTPSLGKFTELIFVEGHSTDDTWNEIKRVSEKYKKSHKIKIMQQSGKGKGDAVRRGFQEASGDILTILDGDLTVHPRELTKFYNVIASRQADFANGCRLVYPMEKKAMRFFNVLGNKFFSLAFSWLLDQPIKDTLCGTKILLKKDYLNIAANREYFGDFDPFGDYDLLFGASKLNLKIKEIPIRYQARTYGDTNIQRWRHGFLLFKMVFFAMRKIKFY